MDLLGDMEMTMERTWKVPTWEVKLGGMPPDTPRLALPLQASLFYITHDFYYYDLMTFLKNFRTRHWMGPRKSVSNRAPHLLRRACQWGSVRLRKTSRIYKKNLVITFFQFAAAVTWCWLQVRVTLTDAVYLAYYSIARESVSFTNHHSLF